MTMRGELSSGQPRMSLTEKFIQVNWTLVLLLIGTAGIGCAMLYSAANGSVDPWAERQALRFVVGLAGAIVVAMIDIRIWMRLAYPIYFVTLTLLVGVEIMGEIGMGAQRWIDLGIIQLQPSELMKISLVLALARYFHGLTLEEIARPLPVRLIAPVLLIVTPA
ncbi:MAG TPA: FtsW/RodA/SpoVE family cell cycle protein, partial [Alphaproteobacteria bacterium]|nr:FtsW/RodA/SpoVE family cell cycle protein [Alphaproteobacteria bacterium]